MTCRGVSIRGGGDRRRQSRQWRRMGVGYPRYCPGRIAQRESARFTRGRSLVRSQVRPLPIDFDRSAVTVAEMGRAGRLCEDSPSVVLATVATRRWGRAIARVAEAAGPPRRRFYLRTQGSGELRRIRLSALARRRCSSPCKGRATAGRPPQHHPWRLEAAAVCGNSRGDEAQRLRRVEPVGIADAVALAVCDERVVGEDDVRSSEQVGAA